MKMLSAFHKYVAIVILLLLINNYSAIATHLMGGTMYYTYVGNNKYALEFVVFRDCSSGSASMPASIMYSIRGATGYPSTSYKTIYRNGSITSIGSTIANCSSSSYCSQKGVFRDTITLGTDAAGYHVWYTACCRNGSINNLSFASSASISWYSFIPERKMKNSSPTPVKDLIPTVCAGRKNIFNAGFYDPDGDSLVFSLTTPYDYIGPPTFSNVNYNSSYNVTYPFGTSSPPATIDKETGEITASPKNAGNYVLAIKIEEYRVDPFTKKATKLSEVRVDVQFISVACYTSSASNQPPEFEKDTLGYTRRVDPGKEICITINALDTNKISSSYDKIRLTAAGSMFGNISAFPKPYATFAGDTNTKTVSSQFCWKPSCEHITYTSPHLVTFKIGDEGCNELERTYKIYVNPKPFVPAPKLKCLSILDSNIIKLQWDSIAHDTSFKQYVIYRKKQNEEEFTAVKILTNSANISWTDSTANGALDTIYQYFIRSANDCEEEGQTSDTLSSIVLKLNANANANALISWNSLRKGLKDSFVVETDFGSGFVPYDTVLVRAFQISKCYNNLTIKVKEVANSSSCFSESGWKWIADTLPPIKKRIFNATATTGNKVRLTFVKSPSPDISKYIVQRSSANGAYKILDTIIHTINSDTTIDYTDKFAGSVKWPVCYKVIAVDSCGHSTEYDSHCPISLTGSTGQLEIKLTWKPYSGFPNKKYSIENWDGSGGWNTLTTLDSSNKTYTHTGLKCSTYYYRILGQEIDNPARYTYSDSIAVSTTDTIAPEPPIADYVRVTSSSSIDISFLASPSQDVKEYRIWVRKDGGAATALDTVSSDGSNSYIYQHKSIDTRNHHYSYDIKAVDACKENNSIPITICPMKFNAGAGGNLAAKLAWTSNGCFSTNKQYIERWNNGVWSMLDSVSGTQTSYKDSFSLHCNQIVYYRIFAKSNSAVAYYSYTDSIAVKPYDSITPQKADFLSATVLDGSSIQITFDTVADADVNRYVIYVKKNSGTFTAIDTIKNPAANPVTYIHTGINALNDTFRYQVKALDSCSDLLSKTSETHTAIQLKGTEGNYANTLNWNKYEGFAIKNYVVQRLEGTSWKDISTLSSADFSYTDAPIPCQQVQYYRIKALEDSGNKKTVLSDTIALTPFDTVKPVPPVITYTTYKSGTVVDIFWQKTISNDVKQYIIYRKNVSSSFKAIDTVGDVSSYTDTLPNADPVQYCYTIRAMDSCVNNIGAYATMHCPVNIQADTNVCNQKIYVDWTAYVGFAGGVKEYNVYKKEASGTEALYTTVSGNQIAFIDTIVDYKKTYCYRIEAVPNTGTFSSFSSSSCEKTYEPEIPHIVYVSKMVTSATNGEVKIKWSSVAGKRFYHYYNIFYKGQNDANYYLLKGNIPITQDSFIHKNINTADEDHFYKIAIVDSCGNNKSLFAPVHKTINLEVNVGQLTHKIWWTPYVGFAVDSYYVERLEGGSFKTLKVFHADTNTVVFPAPCNFNIFYRIKAVDADGNFSYSDTIGRQAIDTIPSNSAILVNASVTSGNSVDISFIGADSADMYQYVIQRANNGSWGTAGAVDFTSPADRHLFKDTTNTLDDYLCYTLLTLDSCLNVSYSDTFCVPQLKGTPLNQATSISWHPFKGYPLKGYKIHRWENNAWNLLATLDAADTTFTEDSLHCYLPYFYQVEAVGADNNPVSFSDSVSITPFDTINPPAPQMRYVNVHDDNKTVDIAWRFDNKSDVKYFEIWRNTDGGAYNKLGTVTFDSTFTDTTAMAGINKHSYYVISTDSCNVTHRSAPSDTDVVSVLQLTNGSCFPVIFMNWSRYAGFAKGAKETEIYRREKNGAAWLKIATLPAGATSYNDTVPKVNGEYCYKVASKAIEGDFIASSGTFCYEPWVFPLPDSALMVYTTVTATGDVTGSIEIEWPQYDAVKDTFARGYRLYHRTGNNAFTLLRDIKDLSITSFSHKNINTVDVVHQYYIAVYNVCNREGKPSIVHEPVNLSMKNLNLQAALSWNSYKGEEVEKYELYKKKNDSDATLIAILSPSDTMFNDTNLLCRQHYMYELHIILKNGKTSKADTLGIDAFDDTPPAAPNQFFASVITTNKDTGKIDISYIGNNEKNRSGYNLYRSVDGDYFELYRLFSDLALSSFAYQDTNINTAETTYSYYFTSLDSCGNESMGSDTHTVVHLDAKAYSEYIKIDWSAYKGFQNLHYVLERRQNAGLWSNIGVFAMATQSYIDSAVKCHQFYEYRIRTEESASTYFSLSNISGDTAFETVLPIAPVIKQVTVTNTGVGNGSIRIAWNKSVSKDAATYFVERSIDSFVWSLASSNIDTFVFDDTNINTAEKSYYYRIWVADSCGNVSEPASAPHRSILLEATPGNQQVRLKWNKYEGWDVKQYNIYRNGQLLASIPGNETQLTDSFVLCINYYNYKVEAVSANDTLVISASNMDSAQPWDFIAPNAPYLKRVTVSVANSELMLEWEASNSFDAEKYFIYKKAPQPGSQPELIDSTEDLEYSVTGNITSRDCFFVKAKDYCTNLSVESNYGCPIILDARNEDGYNILSWNAYKSWRDGVESYNVYKKEDQGNLEIIGNTKELHFTDAALGDHIIDYCYTVEAVENPGSHNAISTSTTDCVHQNPIVYVPNVFTPEEPDQLNDSFGPQGMYIRAFDMKIYNRWGQLIYETSDSKNWDGKMNGGKMAPVGLYMYYITIKGHNKGDIHYKGQVYILR